MSAIIGFFQNIGAAISALFGFIGDILSFVVSIPSMAADLASTIAGLGNILPAEVTIPLAGGIALIITIAILKYVWIGGDPE